ncbi:hypothetical protein RD792_014437 [Penstemon davidsonii]|uniref:NB-ARC domain-containing protein n=1 Tax=Penstemon davidsonii TaxID=160366 RepID=A0ABR0CQC0_9LAMI|nr:hypothetical protein RD792_014437 [Penstemon davidsonii]
MMQKRSNTPAIEIWLDMLKNAVYESHVYGRTSEKEEIIKLLVSDHYQTIRNMPHVIPIIGMGGIGKTTLAQMVYNDKRVNELFDVKAWAYVSDDFNSIRITKSLLESATAKPCDTMNLELLQGGLKDTLNKKKFLVVLDDVWNEKLDSWNDLSIPFLVGSPGSKIIVTTRNEEVISNMNAFPPNFLKEISDEACWSLFVHHAFGSQMHSDLIPIGRQIMNKCKGLPLALKTLGRILASRLDTNYWNAILNSNLWEMPPRKNAILPSLRLSYHHLPSNLKRCFAYCSIFPKGYEFDKKNLVMLWMAEGFVQPPGKNSLEEVGEEYFSELLSRSFFQESVQDNNRYVMHDLLNDLAQSVSRKTCIHLGKNWERGMHENFKKVRHFSCFRSKYDVYRKFESLNEAKWLRNLVNLQMLPQFTVGCSGSSIGDLRNLMHLQSSLWISRLENVASSWDARRANLHKKRGLKKLVFQWSTNSDELIDEKIVTDVLEMLQPNPKLENIKVNNYPGKRFPSWIGDPTFSILVILTSKASKT